MYNEEEKVPATEEQKKMIAEMKKMEGEIVQIVGHNGVEVAIGEAEVLDRCIIINSSNGRYVVPTVKYKYIKMVMVDDEGGGKVLLNVSI